MNNNSPRQQQRKEKIVDTLNQTIERLQRLVRIVESQDRFTMRFSEEVKRFDDDSLKLSSDYSNFIYNEIVNNKENAQ